MAFQAKGGGEGGGRLNLGRDRSLTGVRLGEWKCKSQLGSGSFGIVHVWENAATGENVAVKKCRFGAEVTLSKKHKDQWRQEVDIMLRLDHSNVVRCREAPAEFEPCQALTLPLPLSPTPTLTQAGGRRVPRVSGARQGLRRVHRRGPVRRGNQT